jgi:hypothetical protein
MVSAGGARVRVKTVRVSRCTAPAPAAACLRSSALAAAAQPQREARPGAPGAVPGTASHLPHVHCRCTPASMSPPAQGPAHRLPRVHIGTHAPGPTAVPEPPIPHPLNSKAPHHPAPLPLLLCLTRTAHAADAAPLLAPHHIHAAPSSCCSMSMLHRHHAAPCACCTVLIASDSAHARRMRASTTRERSPPSRARRSTSSCVAPCARASRPAPRSASPSASQHRAAASRSVRAAGAAGFQHVSS